MDTIMKALGMFILSSKESFKLRGNVVKISRLDFALITAYAKPRIYCEGIGKALIQPKKSKAGGALDIHGLKVMNDPRRTKRMVCNRKKLSRQRRKWWWWWQWQLRL